MVHVPFLILPVLFSLNSDSTYVDSHWTHLAGARWYTSVDFRDAGNCLYLNQGAVLVSSDVHSHRRTPVNPRPGQEFGRVRFPGFFQKLQRIRKVHSDLSARAAV